MRLRTARIWNSSTCSFWKGCIIFGITFSAYNQSILYMSRFGITLLIVMLSVPLVIFGVILWALTRGFYIENRYEVVDIDLLHANYSAIPDTLADTTIVPVPMASFNGLDCCLELRVQFRIFSDSSESSHKSFGTYRCCGNGIRDSICAVQWLMHPLSACSPAMHGEELKHQSRDSAAILAIPSSGRRWDLMPNATSLKTDILRTSINHAAFRSPAWASDQMAFHTFPDHVSRRHLRVGDHVGIRLHFQSGRQLSAWLRPSPHPARQP